LVAVFVPVAFFPGTAGILFRQFALTIAFSVAISAFNALTLSPALAAILLGRKHGEKGFFFSRVNQLIIWATQKYRSSLGRLLHFEAIAMLIFVAALGLTYWAYQRLPRGFIPNEDQGYFITVVQAPQGASLQYTTKVMQQVEKVMMQAPEVEGVFAVGGFSLSGSAPNRAAVFGTMKPIGTRKGDAHSVEAVVNRLRGPLMGISGAFVIPFNPPPVNGLGSFDGFQFVLQDQTNHTLEQFAKITQDLVQKGNTNPALSGLFSDFTASDPQVLVTIDREKAKSLQVPLSQVTDALQVYMGSEYVNDFDFNNRSYRVYLQADSKFRSQPKDIRQYYLRSDTGKMISLDNLVGVEQTANPQVIPH